MTKQLKISADLSLPLDFVTERIAFLARTGAGKSGGMRVLAEQMCEAAQFFVFLDPKGDAWGVRSDYSVLIMGGEHGDVPLEPRSGSFVADFLVRERISTVLDVSEFTEGEMVRFVADFAERFYRTNRAAVHWFLDEADEFAPQSGYNAEALKCLGAIQRIQRRGRGRGIGVTLASQRSAVINKSVLTQAGTLIAMQTTAPHDLDAVDKWLQYAATKDARNIIMGALTSLKEREAFIYSPQFLGVEPRRITFAKFKSFDSMRTPKHGEVRQQPKQLADIDLSAVKKDMAATIEKAKAEDPKELRKKIAELTRQANSKTVVPDADVIEKAVSRAVSEAQKEWKQVQQENTRAIQDLRGRLTKIAQLATLNGFAPPLAEYKAIKPRVIEDRPAPAPRRLPQSTGSTELGQSGLRRMLVALAQRPQGLSVGQIGVRAGLSSKSGSFNTYLSRARSNGWIQGSRNLIQITDEGLCALGDYDPLPMGDALLQYWLRELGGGASRILSTLAEAYPNELSKADIAERSELSGTSGSFNTYLSRLRSLELIAGRGEVKASDELFD